MSGMMMMRMTVMMMIMAVMMMMMMMMMMMRTTMMLRGNIDSLEDVYSKLSGSEIYEWSVNGFSVSEINLIHFLCGKVAIFS